ncbi:MAG: CAP domain-containing protein [Chloroflexaceae bacterium]|jgi:uncharacterized protein YkwD|nr:CAP domain-containing protein [Chloroflexaceae bacterium]
MLLRACIALSAVLALGGLTAYASEETAPSSETIISLEAVVAPADDLALEPAAFAPSFSRVFLPLVQKAGASSNPPTPTPTPPPTPPSPGPSTADSLEQQVLALVNQERAKVANCPALVSNTSLMQAARGHSSDMATNNYFSHTGLNGSTPSSRARAAGYTSGGVGENIAAGYSSPASVMEGWMESDGHRANILNCSYRTIGVGYATNSGSRYRTYWTQKFGTR